MKTVYVGCQYPECRAHGVIEFAMVPLCTEHYTKVLGETLAYYEKRIDRYADRSHYLKINHLIPWRNREARTQRWGRS